MGGGGVVIEKRGKGNIRILVLPASAEVATEVPVSGIGRVWRPQAVNRRAKFPPDWSALFGMDRRHVADRAMCPVWSTFPALAPPTPAKRGRDESKIARIRQASKFADWEKRNRVDRRGILRRQATVWSAFHFRLSSAVPKTLQPRSDPAGPYRRPRCALWSA